MRPYSDNQSFPDQSRGFGRPSYDNQGYGDPSLGKYGNPGFRGPGAASYDPNRGRPSFSRADDRPDAGLPGPYGWNADFARGTFAPGFGSAPTFGGPAVAPGAAFDRGSGGESARPDDRPDVLPDDDEIVEMIYDAFEEDPFIPWNADIEVRSDGGLVTLTGTVTSRQIKRAAGDDAWWVIGVDDVRNEIHLSESFPSTAFSTETFPPGTVPPETRPTYSHSHRSGEAATDPVQRKGSADSESEPSPTEAGSGVPSTAKSATVDEPRSGGTGSTGRRRARRA